MPDPIDPLPGTFTVQDVGTQSDATAKAVNALLGMEWAEGDDWDILQADANIRLVHPKNLGTGGGGNGALLWDVIVNGQAGTAYFDSTAPVLSS